MKKEQEVKERYEIRK